MYRLIVPSPRWLQLYGHNDVCYVPAGTELPFANQPPATCKWQCKQWKCCCTLCLSNATIAGTLL